MKSVLRIALLIALIIQSHQACAQQRRHKNDTVHSGQMTLVIKNLPTFDEYPAEAATDHIATDIDFSSNSDAKRFRTALRDGLKKGANFDGHYAVVTYGCGTGCQGNMVVDVNNGKVVGGFNTTYGSSFKPNSGLLIADYPGPEAEFPNDDVQTPWHDVRFFTVRDDELQLVKALHIYKMFVEEKKN